MAKFLLTLSLAAFLLSACGKQTDTVTLTLINSLDVERRGEIVEVLLADIFRKTEAVAYQLGRDGKAKAGRNHFKLLCNGVLLEDLAPGETNGYFQAIRKKYVVRNDTDHLSLSFQSVSGKCFLNAIKLRRIQ